MTTIVRTLLGDVDPESLGWVNYHEHLFQASPLLPGEELDDPRRSQQEAQLLVASGVATMIDATPLGLGRRIDDAAAISERTGLGVVHATGAHHGGHYPEDHPIRSLDEDALTELFTAEVIDGFRPEPWAAGHEAVSPEGARRRAGVVKTGIRLWSIGPFERRILAAAAATHRSTGVAIMVHTEHGSATFEVLRMLAEHGVMADRVILAHMDRNLDSGLHRELAASGAYLGYDGPARHQYHSDEAILECAVRVAETHADRLLLGGDVARRSRYLAYGGMPGLPYLTTRFVPRLVERIGAEAVDEIMRANAARVLAFAPLA